MTGKVQRGMVLDMALVGRQVVNVGRVEVT